MTNFRIIFIHGYNSSHNDDWYSNIATELRNLEVDFVIPDFPGGTHPHSKEWLEMLHVEISKSQKPVVLVGHSLGTRLALLYLEKYREMIQSVFLIAPFSNTTENASSSEGELYQDFFEHQINIRMIAPLVRKFIVMHSKDDSSIPYEQGVEIAGQLNAKLLSFEDRGHFSDPSNAPIILEALRNELHF